MDRMNITYEKLMSEHLPYMYDIRFSVKENLPHAHQIQYLQKEQAEQDISQGGGWMCKIDNQYAGYAFGIWVPEPLLGGLFVRPEFTRHGVGSHLLDLVTGWFFSEGAQEVTLTTDPDSLAEKFYKKRGWSATELDEFGQLIFVKKKVSYD